MKKLPKLCEFVVITNHYNKEYIYYHIFLLTLTSGNTFVKSNHSLEFSDNFVQFI